MKKDGKRDLSLEEKNKIVEKRFEELIKVDKSFSEADNFKVIEKAFRFAQEAHEGDFRKSGLQLPFIVHPIAVAKIVAEEMGFGLTMVQAALLHDTVEDTDVTLEELEKKFGKNVAFLVESVTKITHDTDSRLTEQVATFKQLIISMTRDRRVAYLKIADRLHNLRTMWGMRENSKMVKTAESIDLYAPLAHLLGLFNIKGIIEDFSFRYREPEEFERLKTEAENYRKRREDIDKKNVETLYEVLSKLRFNFDVVELTKSLYKAWRITVREQLPLAKIHNYRSLRIVLRQNPKFSALQQCYLVYATLSESLNVRPRSMKDWISYPKSNGFRAILADVFMNGEWHEIQIMTDSMHLVAQRGYADDYDNSHQRNIDAWVRDTKKELEKPDLTDREIMDLLRPQEREINVFTPEGEIVRLNKGATVLDFAFKIHTDLGLHFRSAEVNGNMVPYSFKLRYGDEVKIIHDPAAKPQQQWLPHLEDVKYRTILKRYFNREKRKITEHGKDIFEAIDHKDRYDKIKELLQSFNCLNEEELFYKLGCDKISEKEIIRQLNRSGTFSKLFGNMLNRTEEISYVKKKLNGDEPVINFNCKKVFEIDDVNEYIFFAECCRPVQGDTAIVHKVSDNRFVVHKRSCPNALEINRTNKEMTAAVQWRNTIDCNFSTIIKLEGEDRPNLLSDLTQIISQDMNLNMNSLNITADGNLFKGIIRFEVADRRSLESIIGKIKKVKNIRSVYRST